MAKTEETTSQNRKRQTRKVQASAADFALHTLGWKAFQDLAVTACEDVFGQALEVYREAQDGGQDGAFARRKADAGYSLVVQCKFSSIRNKSFKLSDIKSEEPVITSLLKQGGLDHYVVVTSCSVSGLEARNIKNWCKSLGVTTTTVYGKEFLTKRIRDSARLRALVPRVYGLGDLSVILDERLVSQTNELLGHLRPSLITYVPTQPHTAAVKALQKHKIVLLLGDPATGKSTIAAVLGAYACQQKGRSCYKCESPNELAARWNPNEKDGFYWIDDAFGPNQLRHDHVDDWLQIMPKIQAAISKGNMFVLTSRSHIYRAAEPKLGTRNLPLFRDRHAIVEVGSLKIEEKRQILYNHIKYGNQTKLFKYSIRPHLDDLAKDHLFIPEIARRLGDSSYTKNLSITSDSLIAFVRQPHEFLLSLLNELSKPNQAALTLVHASRSELKKGSKNSELWRIISDSFHISDNDISNAFSELRDSFLVEKVVGDVTYWTFKHPTISDAISFWLGRSEGMAELYLRGAKLETILTDVACEDAPVIRDAVIIPDDLTDKLIDRLSACPDELRLNTALFRFIATRMSARCVRHFMERNPRAFDRAHAIYGSPLSDARLRASAKVHELGLLDSITRDQCSERIRRAILKDGEVSLLRDDGLLSLVKPTQLALMVQDIRKKLLPTLDDKIVEFYDGADLELDGDDNFYELRSTIETLKDIFEDDEGATKILDDADSSIDYYVEEIDQKRREKEQEEEDKEFEQEEESFFSDSRPSQRSTSSASDNAFDGTSAPRSIFSDLPD